MLRSWVCDHVTRLTIDALARVAVPVVAAVAVRRTGIGAAGIGHAAALLHVHFPRLRETHSSANTQTLQGNNHTFKQRGEAQCL